MAQRREGTRLGPQVIYGHLEEVIVKDLEGTDREVGLRSQGDRRPCPKQQRHLLRMMSAQMGTSKHPRVPETWGRWGDMCR